MAGWEREIVELHEFFERLFLGQTESLDRADQALASDFTMAGPHGVLSQRADVMGQLGAGIGHASELSIRVEDPRLILETDDTIVAEYIEVHGLSGDRQNRRRSTVVFEKDAAGPNGLRWLRVHETWIDPAG